MQKKTLEHIVTSVNQLQTEEEHNILKYFTIDGNEANFKNWIINTDVLDKTVEQAIKREYAVREQHNFPQYIIVKINRDKNDFDRKDVPAIV